MNMNPKQSLTTKTNWLRTASLIAFLLINLQSKSQTVSVNDSLVPIPKSIAQNILKSDDSCRRVNIAYKALQLNYNRLKQKSYIQDTAYKYKEKEATICRELLKNQQSQTDMWSIKSHQQSKEIKKQKFLKWVFIIIGAAGVGWGITK